jgi:hypothetical protein
VNGNFSSNLATITSTGNVGIGTSSPSSPLHVEAASGTDAITISRPTFGQAGVIREAAGAIAVESQKNLLLEADVDSAFAGSASNIIMKTDGSEAMRIDSSGNFLFNTTDTNPINDQEGLGGIALRNSDSQAFFASPNAQIIANRISTDGVLVQFRQDGTIEGDIAVSGTTVSYNGGHLSRWSRLPDGTDDTHIYKGTVMTNLDEMCEWKDEQGDLEDNEQLNKTTVSTQEGDPNVAGLFVAWDEDDDWGDYYLAMTGDLVVRIAQGVTVQRGDLLMSAGDGTAKPQGDDIVRSKTVAKVTSNHTGHTYPDGSYAVPCVVMAS